jgi:hypothetical protein
LPRQNRFGGKLTAMGDDQEQQLLKKSRTLATRERTTYQKLVAIRLHSIVIGRVGSLGHQNYRIDGPNLKFIPR